MNNTVITTLFDISNEVISHSHDLAIIVSTRTRLDQSAHSLQKDQRGGAKSGQRRVGSPHGLTIVLRATVQSRSEVLLHIPMQLFPNWQLLLFTFWVLYE